MDQKMIEALKRELEIAIKQAYSPYSGIKVGAVAVGESGRMFHGCNIENDSFGLTCCAERTAVFNMVANGDKKIKAFAVLGGSTATCMCAICRQVVGEFVESADTEVLKIGRDGDYIIVKFGDLLPFNRQPKRISLKEGE